MYTVRYSIDTTGVYILVFRTKDIEGACPRYMSIKTTKKCY